MGMTVEIGTWHEAGREITRCPSYHAADHETLALEPGDYTIRVTFEGGYLIPMPYWLLVSIDSSRVSGALYSGFGGSNFGRRELPAGERVEYRVQTYRYLLPELVAAGQVTLRPGFEWLLADKPWEAPGAPQDWDAVRDMGGVPQ